jgi:hypothetical protein
MAMIEDSPLQTSQQDSDYDGAWKEGLRHHLTEFLTKYFAAIHAAIDWSRPVEWYDKEVSQVLGQAGSRNKRVDLLVKVWLLSGEPLWILLHLEIQSASESGFERRIAKFNGGLSWTFDQRVVSVVVLADLDANWRPREDVFQVGDFESHLRFPTCKLIDKLESEWKDDVSLPVQMARAQIESLRTAGDPEGRFRAKWQLVRSLYRAGYNADDLRELFRLIDWMMHLREDLEQRFRAELTEFEEQMKMPYVTSVERLAKAEGRTEGRAEGGAGVLVRQLGRLLGPLPEETEGRIRSLSFPELEALGDDLLAFRTLDDLCTWLDRADRNAPRAVQ